MTEDKKTAEAENRREKHLDQIVEATPECIKVVDTDGTLLEMNPAGLAMVEADSGSAVIGGCVYDLIAPEDRDAFKAFHKRVCAGESGLLQFDIIGLGGTRRHVETHAVPLQNHGGPPRQLALTRDITRRKQAEEALRESEERFRAAFHQTSVGMAQSDLQGNHLLVNDCYCNITGYSREELLGCSFLDITHPDDLDRNRASFQELVNQKKANYEIEKRYIRKDGSTVWAQVTASFVHDASGKPTHIIAAVLDISERKRKEQILGFVVDLNSATQPLVEPEEIMRTTARMLGEHLDADRCAYAEVGPDETHLTIRGDYTRGVASLVGRFAFSAFGPEVLPLMRAGKAYVVDDTEQDPRAGEDLSTYRQIQARSGICVPLHKAGRLVAIMAVHQKTPRHWTPEEIELTQLVVGRCWESMERARSVRNLRESENRLRFVLDSMPQKIFSTTPEGNADYFNPQWTEYTGLPVEQLVNWGWTKIIHPDDLQENVRAWRLAVETGEFFQLEHRFRYKDGHYRWHVTRAVPMRGPQGEIVAWIGSNTDIHDVKSAEEAANQRSQQVRGLAALATRLSTTSDVDSVMDVVAQEARALIGAHQSVISFTAEDGAPALVSVSLSEKYAQWAGYDTQPKGSGIYATVSRTNKPMRLSQAELTAHPNWQGFGSEAGKHPPLRGWLAAPLVDKNNTNIGVIQLSDKHTGEFTEDDEAVLVQLARMTSVALENARLLEDLRHTNQRKDEFLATLAHELRNPLSPMRNTLELMKHSDGGKEAMDQARMVMERHLLHMVRLIDDLLDVSRISRGKLELRLQEVELAAVVTQAVDAAKTLAKCAELDIEVALPEEPVYLKADPARLVQVLVNLLDNACKYTHGEGKVWVSAEPRGDQVLVKVRDTGIGIPPDQLDEIFEMFSQVDQPLERQQEGLGIGLTLVKRFVQMHGGTITARSAGEGKGSEFDIHLPTVNASETPARQPVEPATETMPEAHWRVLVVDDNRDNAASLASVLQVYGHQVYTAHDGLEAIEACETRRPDVLLLDIGMPVLNGYDVCRRIREQPWGKNMLIIAVSGWGQEQDRQRSQEAGFDHHLVKPVNIAKLTELLAKHGAGQTNV